MPASMESLPIGGHEKFAEEIFGKVKDLGHVEVIQLSQAEYDALSTAEKNDPTKIYCVPGNGSFFKVIDITQAEYDELSTAEKQNPQNLYLIEDETEYLTQGATYVKVGFSSDYSGWISVTNDPEQQYKNVFGVAEEVDIWKKTQQDPDPAVRYRVVGSSLNPIGTKFCVDAELTNGLSAVIPTNHGKLYGGATVKADLDLATMFGHTGEHPFYWRCSVTFTAAQIADSYNDEVVLISVYSAVEERTITVSLKNGKIFTSTTGTGKTFETDYTVTAGTPYLIAIQIGTTAGYEDFSLFVDGDRLMHDYTWTYWVVSEPVITLKQGLHIVGNMMCDLAGAVYSQDTGYYFIYRYDHKEYDGACIGRTYIGSSIYKVEIEWLGSITNLVGTYLEMDSFTYPAKINEIYVNAQGLSTRMDDYNDADSGRQQTWVPIGLEAMREEIESLKARIAVLENT